MSKDFISQIDALFNPRSIAIIGVSDKRVKLGNILLKSFIDIGFDGKLYPINTREKTVMGLKSYPRLKDIDGSVDLIVIAVHPDKVSKIIEDAVEKGVKGAIIFSAGYREKGNDGKQREQELVNIARKGNLRIIGPNCMGFYCPSTKLSFFPGLSGESGPVAFISQSGSISNIVAFVGYVHGIGFSKIISLGNSCDLDFNDFLEYLGEDPKTRVIACYLEGIKNGQRFLRLAKKVSMNKPIIVWKVGRTESGAKAAGSHTGSISGNKEVWNAVFKQAGLIRVENLSELFGRISALIKPILPKGNRVAVISAPGGPAVSTADACEQAGLRLAEFSNETRKKLSEIVPEFGTSVSNPVDMGLIVTYDKTIYPLCTEIVGQDENVDMILVFHFVIDSEYAENFIAVQNKIQKPIAIATNMEQLYGIEASVLFKSLEAGELSKTLRGLYESGISMHSTEQDAAKTLVSLLKYKEFLDKANREISV
ncbi:MAG: acetate--CoA ligase family protein [Candidatus Lokiarchaeia archaeon]